MRARINIGILFAVCLLLVGCQMKAVRGDGNLVTEIIPISDYEKLEASSASMKIKYVQSDEAPFLKVTVDKNIYDMYDFQVEDGNELRIIPKQSHRQIFFSPTEFTVVTNSRHLRKAEMAGQVELNVDSRLITDKFNLEMAGSVVVNLNDSVITDNLDVEIAGSGQLNAMAIRCNFLKGDIAGSGNLNLGGFADECSYEIAGSGSVHSFNLESNRMNGEIAGSGSLEIFVNEQINMAVAGIGKVKYKGNASVHSDGAFMSSFEKVD